MGLARFYLPELTTGNFGFSPEEARHIAGAKRLKVGDQIEVFDGRGNYLCVDIAALKSRKVEVVPAGELVFEEKKAPIVEIAVAVPKSKRLQYLIEKLSELGVASVVPVIFERSVAGGNDPVEKYTRWAVEACKQSRNLWIPKFSSPVKFEDYLAGKVTVPVLMADLTGGSIVEVLGEERGDAIACLVGPEGGFSDAEFAMAEDAGILKVALAKNILRIETAAVAFASTLMALSR